MFPLISSSRISYVLLGNADGRMCVCVCVCIWWSQVSDNETLLSRIDFSMIPLGKVLSYIKVYSLLAPNLQAEK